jgi:hypothetical protein
MAGQRTDETLKDLALEDEVIHDRQVVLLKALKIHSVSSFLILGIISEECRGRHDQWRRGSNGEVLMVPQERMDDFVHSRRPIGQLGL